MNRFTWIVPAVVLSLTPFGHAADQPDRSTGRSGTNTAIARAEAPKGETYLDPEKAGLEYKLQGEYVGQAGGSKLGAQVIALGGDKFHVVFEPGGLPGEGWDGKKVEIDGQGEGEKTTFEGKGYTASFKGDALTGKGPDGAFELKKVVRHSPTEGAKPPSGAIVLFDGTNADAWVGGHTDERHLLASGPKTKQSFKDYTLHAEFLLPFKPYGRGQDRANSGVYMQDRYEIQVLDSFGLKGANNECGAIYSQVAPSVNMCYPPLTWQTYDIDFTAARYDDKGTRTPPVITLRHNGVVVLDKVQIKGPTGGGQKEDPKQPVQSGPLQLQGHGNPVFYRNIWIVEKNETK